jgi:hypothetical protein
MSNLERPISADYWRNIWGICKNRDEPAFTPPTIAEFGRIARNAEMDSILMEITSSKLEEAYWLWNHEHSDMTWVCPNSEPGDARTIFGDDYFAFRRAGSPWFNWRGVYPHNLGMLLTAWRRIDSFVEKQREFFARAAALMPRRPDGGIMTHLEVENMIKAEHRKNMVLAPLNPHVVSAFFEATTGEGINIPFNGLMGGHSVASMMQSGLKPPPPARIGLRPS